MSLSFLPTSLATAKSFAPGDVRLCNDKACVDIVDHGTLRALSRFYYGGPEPAEVHAPRLGTQLYELTFRNGYVTGVAASTGLDRFRTGGVNTAQFGPDDWYRIPPTLAQALRRLASHLRPMHVTQSTIGATRYG